MNFDTICIDGSRYDKGMGLARNKQQRANFKIKKPHIIIVESTKYLSEFTFHRETSKFSDPIYIV
jgi:hypothetical protein